MVGEGTNVFGAHASTIYTGSGAGADTLAGLAAAINTESSTLGAYATVGTTGITMTTGTWNGSSGTPTGTTNVNLSVSGNSLSSSTTGTQLSTYMPQIAGQLVTVGTPAVTTLDNGTATSAAGDTLTGSITLTNSSGSYTFIANVSGTDAGNTFYLNNTVDGSTYTGLVDAITSNSAELGYGAAFTAGVGALSEGGVVLTANANGANPITVTGVNTLADTTNAGNVGADAGGLLAGIPSNGTDNVNATSSTAILQLASTNINDATAVLGGALSLTFNGNTQVFIMGNAPSDSTFVPGAIYTGGFAGDSVTQLVEAINSAGTLGLTASAPGTGTGGIYLQGGNGVVSAITMNTIAPNNDLMTPLAVTSAYGSLTPVNATTGVAGNNAVHTVTAAVPVSTSDTLAGTDGGVADISIKNSAGGITDTFIVGTGSNVPASHEYYTNSYGDTLAGLAAAITALSDNGVTAQANTSGLTITQNGTATTYTGGTISVTGNTLTDATQGTYSTSTSTQLANESDKLSGALVFTVGSAGATQTVNMSDVTGAGDAGTAAGLIKYINDNSINGLGLGISAAWVPAGGGSTFGAIQLTSGTQGSQLTTDTVDVSPALTDLADTTTGSALTYTAGSAYSTGLSSTSGITDATTTAAATFASDNKAGSGIATISYTDAAGVSLSATDLLNQTDAQGALTLLNSAITAVAAQDGYIGAQINTLNAVSQVLSTQSENVKSAQNAVQATDYAAATSNMSKYEILSQTGIAALAQANTVQQEVLKLI